MAWAGVRAALLAAGMALVTAATAGTYTNPVIPGDKPDPGAPASKNRHLDVFPCNIRRDGGHSLVTLEGKEDIPL